MHEDITTKKGVRSENIVSKIAQEIKGYARSHHYSYNNFKQIIHIVDIDGAYLDQDKIHEDTFSKKLRYSEEGIYTSNVKGIVARNTVKKDNIFRLESKSIIWNIPYRVYYMSSNLDHVLYNKLNSSDNEKENDAYAFAKKYKNDVNGFVKYMCDSDFSVKGNYRDSWAFLKSQTRSIVRCSNL